MMWSQPKLWTVLHRSGLSTEDVSEYNRFGKTVFMLMVILLELIWVSRSTNYAGEARLTCFIL